MLTNQKRKRFLSCGEAIFRKFRGEEEATQAYMEIRRGADDEANEDSALL